MLKKIREFCFDFPRNFYVSFLCCFVFVIIVVSVFKFDEIIKPVFVYPEEEYKILEQEAYRIIEEKELNTEFKHSVNYTNDFDSKTIVIKLEDESHIDVSVDIVVKNYQQDTQTLSVMRNGENDVGYYFANALVLVVACGILAFAIWIIFLIFFIIGGCTSWLIEAIAKGSRQNK